MGSEQNIDIVITWVDGSDPAWLEEKAKYQQKKSGDVRANRYRDWDFLRYWFRAIEENAPWVRNIYFVTWGHLPAWLNTDHPKLKIVNHKDFIPAEYLPTFSCRPIEMNLHRIPGLSERFVYFNDDMFLLRKTEVTDFFKNGLPCDTAVLDAITINETTNDGDPIKAQSLYTTLIFNVAAINRNFNKRESMRKNWRKWYSPVYGKQVIRTLLLTPWIKFTGFKSPHVPYSYLKSTFEDAWQHEEEVLKLACEHKFRQPTDVSSRMFSYWQLAKGTFMPRSPKAGVSTSICADAKKNEETLRIIRNREHKMLCINDDYHGDHFEEIQKQFIDAFESIYPKKSSFER